MKNIKIINLKGFIILLFLITSCVGNMSPNGNHITPDYPYFVTEKPLVVKKILVPIGTTLYYEEHFFKSGKQDKIMSDKKLTTIEFPEGETINWAGIPIKMIEKYFNSEMRGFSVYPDFNKLSDNKKTLFSQLWQSCDDDLGVNVKNIDDWSFNKNNISDISSCSVLYQRYFKEDIGQQQFLNALYAELMKID